MIDTIKINTTWKKDKDELIKPLFIVNETTYYLTQSTIANKFAILDFTNSFVLQLDLYPIDFSNDTMNYYHEVNMHYYDKNNCEPFNTNLKIFMKQNYNMLFPSFYDFIKLVIESYDSNQ